jgi:TPR repeat protein
MALRLWRPLAEQGDARSQNNLGRIYHHAQDYAAAMSWYHKAAEQGHAEAEFWVGWMGYKGQGVPQDYAAAVSWYRKAAEQGDVEAQRSLGFMYSMGNGIELNRVLAHMWVNLAVATNECAAIDVKSIALSMTPAKIAEAQKLAREWKPK